MILEYPIPRRQKRIDAVVLSQERIFCLEFKTGGQKLPHSALNQVEDYALDLVIGEGPAARSVRLDLAPFTLVGATTRAGLLATPLRDRFGIPIRLDFYEPEELARIVMAAARKLGAPITEDGAVEIASRARGTPRIALRLLRRVRDFADAEGQPIDKPAAGRALTRPEIDAEGPDALDRPYPHAPATTDAGGPVGPHRPPAAPPEARTPPYDRVPP